MYNGLPMIENIFVIFAPLTGGNHLANIVSMSDRFVKRFNENVYYNNLFHVHPKSNKTNYAPTEADLTALQGQSNVFCSHLTEYLSAKTLTEHHVPNRKYILLEFPVHSRNSFFKHRISKGLYYNDKYILEELSTMYSIDTFSKLTNEKDLTKINVDLLFDRDVSGLLETLNLELGLNINLQEASKLHQLWLAKHDFK
jgi:hypothetical protein